MPAGRGVRFLILVEDRKLERFVRECLYALGVHTREIRVVDYLEGRGSAKQRIDREYPVQVQAYRRRCSENIALIVGTDADEQTVQQRISRLGQVLRQAELEPRASDERIAIWVPRWHIETWLHDPSTEQLLPSILSAFEETRRIQQALDRASP